MLIQNLKKINKENTPCLDLHGEFAKNVDKIINSFINDLIELNYHYGIIIHGIGSGILRKATQECLKRNSNISEFMLDLENQGITYFYLKYDSVITPEQKNIDKSEIMDLVDHLYEKDIVKSISIKNLFGMFNYEVNFDNNRVFVIHAPNGCGKSNFLNYIQILLNGGMKELLTGPFENIKIKINDYEHTIETYKSSEYEIIDMPKCNYISDLYNYNFESKDIPINDKKIEAFLDIMDEFFCFEKKVTLSKNESGLPFAFKGKNNIKITYEGKTNYTNPSIYKKDAIIDFDELSSGEKFIIKLFYKLIFDLTYNSFVIIDEPEISLHIEWQEMMVKRIVEIANLFDVYVLIATHSPYIVNEPNVEVGAVEYETK